MKQNIFAKKKLIISASVLCALLSVFVITPVTQNKGITKFLNKKLDTQLALAAGFFASAAAASIAISALPGDTGAPLSSQIADVAGFFLMITGIIAFEKVLLLISPFISFSIIIPVAAVFFILFILLKKEKLKQLFLKCLIASFVIFALVPVSLLLSVLVEEKMLGAKLQKDVKTIESSVKTLSAQEVDDQGTWLTKLGGAIKNTADNLGSWLKDKTSSIFKTAQETLQNLINSLISMIITTFIIPLCTMLFFLNITKSLLGVNITKKAGGKNKWEK